MGLFSKHFKQFTSWIDPAGAFVGRETGISDYLTKPEGAPGPPSMPDQASLLQAQTLQASKSAALQYGRAATILGNPGGNQGGTSDKLGP